MKSYKTQRNISWLSPTQKLAILHHYFLKHPNVNRNYNKFDLLSCQLPNERQKEKKRIL